MQWNKVWLMLHLYFAFSFVGSLMVAEWLGGMARRAPEWRDRAQLFEVLRRSTQWAGLVPLVLLGVLGNLVATGTGLRMAADPWLRTVNGAWLLTLIVMVAVALPSIRRLAALSRAAAAGGASEGYEGALRNWRFANLALMLLYIAQLALMVSQAKL
jgi:hypothetical protein